MSEVERALRLAIVLACVAAASLAASSAQAQRCPADQDVAPWVSFDAGDQGPGATTAPADGSIAICSSTSGFGEISDAYRYAFQLRDHGFVLRALVLAVDPGASGGLVVVVPSVSSTSAARLSAEVFVTPEGTAVLRSTLRRASGGTSDAAIAEMPVTLPVSLEIVREGSEVHTRIAGGPIHLTASLDPQSDLMGPVRVGVAQTSNDAGVARSATFSRIALSAPEPGAAVACVENQAAMAGAPFRIQGRHLDAVDGVRIAGMSASIASSSESRIVLESPTPTASFVHGPVEISHDGRFRRVGMATFVGTPIRRGDVDEDGVVGTEDYRALCHHVYRRATLECSAAGDVDGDGDRDADDVDRLRRFLETGAAPPEAPFETAALVEGTLACGQPALPEIHAIERADGAPIDRPVREGDDIVLVGTGLPDPTRAIVRFGGTEATPSITSTSTRLVVRVGQVVAGGPQCPRILDAAPAAPGEPRFGPAFGADDGSPLCVAFEASALTTHLRSRVVDDGHHLEISVPRASLRPGTRLRISSVLYLPYVVGRSRGPRSATLDFVVPDTTYADALGLLAARLSEAIHGQSNNTCGCEVSVLTDVVGGEKLILAPCAALPEQPPQPAIPGLPTEVRRPTPYWHQVDILSDIPGPGCNDDIDRAAQPRRFFWCELEALAEIQGADAAPLHQGLPLWESYDAPVLDVSPDPRQRGTDEKDILVDPLVRELIDFAYREPCEMALRATQCGDDFFATWLPRFPLGGRLIKTFWQPFGNLPASTDETTLYSYDPPGSEPRQYLVGMHVGASIGSISGGDEPPDYFEWSTFWLPSGGSTTTKDGQSLSAYYSPHCTVGFGGDRPASLAATPFAAFEMCTDSNAGEGACGNPWEPGECPPNGTATCTGCHVALGKIYWSGNASSFDPEPLRAGWMATLVSAYASDATACLVDVDTSPASFPPEWIVTPPSIDAQRCSVGF
ncbi:MAG: IPT/TIG domain-containing protein [Myxococcota bacterium]|nr:IPT/TIG domain-containing protein [Myxococcota bacterium]